MSEEPHGSSPQLAPSRPLPARPGRRAPVQRAAGRAAEAAGARVSALEVAYLVVAQSGPPPWAQPLPGGATAAGSFIVVHLAIGVFGRSFLALLPGLLVSLACGPPRVERGQARSRYGLESREIIRDGKRAFHSSPEPDGILAHGS